MHPKSNKKCILFILFSIYFPAFFSQISQEKDNCTKPLRCGSTNISYPFWGGRRTPSCGRPGFQIHCQRDVPLLNISSVFYRILEIDFSNHTLRVAREDLWNKTCPSNLHNTTINPSLFQFPPGSNFLNVTLYFNCTSNQEQLPNQFRCDGDGVNTINLFRSGDASSDITCENNISVPVNAEAAESLKNSTTSSIDVLQAALAAGFSIQWLDSVKYAPDADELRGPSPAQNPAGSSPETEFDYSPTGNGSFTGPLLMGMIGGLIIGITVLAILTVKIVSCVKRRQSSCSPNQESNQDIEKILLQHGPSAPRRYKYTEIKKITKSFKDKLGQGGYGTVYRGILPNGCFVAVKVLIDNNSDGQEFINEVASISRTSHINIVSLLGFCYDENRRALVYEFMPNKSLDKLISSNADCQLDMKKLYEIALGVAKGLEYLHAGCNTRIVHFDIKPQNILLDEEFCPKISDFGLAKLCKRQQSILSMLGTRGTIGYIAPEIFSRNFGGVSHKCDVYSYGMMVLEMVGARNNVETEAIQSSENYFPDKVYDLIIHDVTRKLEDFVNEDEDDTRRKMSLVGFWCIQTIPTDRPSMSKVVEMLEGSLHSIQIPPKPFLFSPRPMEQGCFVSLSTFAETENSSEG